MFGRKVLIHLTDKQLEEANIKNFPYIFYKGTNYKVMSSGKEGKGVMVVEC